MQTLSKFSDFACPQNIDSKVFDRESYADLESFVRGALFIFFDEGEDPNTTISGPPSARKRNAI